MEFIYNDTNNSGIFIQIGSGAGDLDPRSNYRDGFTEFIKKLPKYRVKQIILIEPNPLNIALLKECWKDYPQALIYELAIVPSYFTNTSIDLHYCPDDGPHYHVASIVKEHIYKHYNDCSLNKFVVNTKCLEQLFNELLIKDIELLSLDIEGIDEEIILDIKFNNINIKYFSFEFIHIKNGSIVTQHLIDNNYHFLGMGCDYKNYDYLYVKK